MKEIIEKDYEMRIRSLSEEIKKIKVSTWINSVAIILNALAIILKCKG